MEVLKNWEIEVRVDSALDVSRLTRIVASRHEVDYDDENVALVADLVPSGATAAEGSWVT